MNALFERLNLETESYNYHLPPEAIARYPLAQRNASRLLCFENGQVSHHSFNQLPELLPANTLLVFNNTKVIPARLHFQKVTGTWIEILIVESHPDTKTDGSNKLVCTCMVGNKKKWKPGELLSIKNGEVTLHAEWCDAEKNQVVFSWLPQNQSFYEVISQLGEMPIPPYLNRPSEESDKQSYQTVYAKNEGAIAAPTAGLHFTEEVFAGLKAKGIQTAEVTLHVGIGTFRPMKTTKVAEHEMHKEQVVISKKVIEQLLNHHGPVVAVGTTTLRSLESLYWLGAAFMQTGQLPAELTTDYPYENEAVSFQKTAVLTELLAYLNRHKTEYAAFGTQAYLMPGYTFRMVDALVTNFHQPKSTLLVLISAFVGAQWRKIYAEAVENQYRFLSYGDSSLLWPTA